MGKLFDKFGNKEYRNEAAVTNNFVIPLFTNFLGYNVEELMPEERFPASDLHKGVIKYKNGSKSLAIKPDFVICIEGDINAPKFLLDTKSPKENIADHLGQLKSYATCVGVNILVITNGISLKVYDVNELMFEAKTIEDLEAKFDILIKILSKDVQSGKSILEILRTFDLDASLSINAEQISEEVKKKRKVKLSDFRKYLEVTKNKFMDWQVSPEFNNVHNIKVEKYSPDKLHRFKRFENIESPALAKNQSYTLQEMECKFGNLSKIVFIGSSGIGKTTLLKYIAYTKAKACLNLESTNMPIYITLNKYGTNLSLRNLISNVLAKGEMSLSEKELSEHLQKQDFTFLLDGFDEVNETKLVELKKEIIELSDMEKHRFIITTRPARPLNFPSFVDFEIIPLEMDEVENLLEEYLGNQKFKFLAEIRNKGLLEETRNTLLLTFMILIYKQEQRLPNTRCRILHEIVNRLKKLEINKGGRLTENLSWDLKEEVLSKIALEIIQKKGNLILPGDEANKIVISCIKEFEAKREIKHGTDKNTVINDLTLTGIINFDDGGLSFWHRAFLNYFASKELARKYTEDSTILEKYLTNSSLDYIIINANVFLPDSTEFISKLKNSLDLAARCIIESNYVQDALIKEIVAGLEVNCYSAIKPIRLRAVWLLENLDPNYTTSIFYEILRRNRYSEIKKIALEKVAKTKTSAAKKQVYDLIDWDEGCFPYGGTQGSVAKALSNFEEPEQLEIIKIWRRKPDIFTDQDCEEAFLNIIDTGRLTAATKEGLFEFYFNSGEFHKTQSLSNVIKKIEDQQIVPRLIAAFKERNFNNVLCGLYNEDILASYTSQQIVNLLITAATDKSKDAAIREGCSGALSKSKGEIPLIIFKELLKDENEIIRRNAARALKKFQTWEIKELLLTQINDDSAQVQHEIIETLSDRGLLSEILKETRFPKSIVTKTLFTQIRKFKLIEFLPILEKFEKQYKSHTRLILDIANTYLTLNQTEKATAIIKEVLSEEPNSIDKYCYADLAEIALRLEQKKAVDLIKKLLNSLKELGDTSGFLESKCVESLEEIGSNESLSLLKEIVVNQAKEENCMKIERTLRAINTLASEEDEEWYIKFVETNSSLKSMDLRRAIEGLGIVGSKKSIAIIKKIAKLNRSDEWTIGSCFYSVAQICEKMGLRREIVEKDMFDDKSFE